MKTVNKNLGVYLVFWILPLLTNAHADDLVETELLDIYGSEEFISIATGYKQPVSKAPAVASVIDANQIKKMGAVDIDGVLEMVPGLHVSYSHQGYNPIYTFRGIYSNFNPQVLLLIDGVPQTNLFTGGKNFVWGGMPVEAIERIEIIRGPGSAIYGADSFSGTINVITKSGVGDEGLQAGARYGTFNTKTIFSTCQKKWDESSLFFGLQGNKTDGFNSIIDEDAQTYLDNILGTSASIAPDSVNMSRENVDVNVDFRHKDFVIKANYQGRGDVGNGAGIAQALDPSSRYKSDRYQIDINYTIENLFKNLSVIFSGNYLDVSQEVEKNAVIYPPGSTGPFLNDNGEPLFDVFSNGVIASPEVYEKHSRLNTTILYQGFEGHDLRIGLGYYLGDLYKVKESKNYCTDVDSCAYILPFDGVVDVSETPFVFLREGTRENHYIYVQDVYSLANDWELTAGIRYDSYSDFGETINPRLALVWSTTNDLTTKFLYGEAFRAPAFAETRAINNPSALGNPNLKPETLKSYEVVFDYTVNYELDFIFNSFYYEWKDIIQFVADGSGATATAQNAGRQDGYGVELESKWKITEKFTLLANFSWQKSRNKQTKTDSAGAPEKQFYVQGDWMPVSDLNFNIQANWVMDRNREFVDSRSEIDDFVQFDMTLRKKNIWQHVEAALIVKNIFNENVREPSPNSFPVPGIPNDLPLAGRSVFGEIRYNF
jgi:iron complex outermembrane receptor protein